MGNPLLLNGASYSINISANISRDGKSPSLKLSTAYMAEPINESCEQHVTLLLVK